LAIQAAFIMNSLSERRGRQTVYDGNVMSLTLGFDPLAIVVDWLDACRSGDLHAVLELYEKPGPVAASFALSLLGWIVGTGEVWLALHFLGSPVGWTEALLLESLGQAIRGAAFAIPGSLGVQEGGYLLLARLIGLPPEAALALSLAKRARELLFGLPGIVYLHFAEKGWQRRRLARVPEIE